MREYYIDFAFIGYHTMNRFRIPLKGERLGWAISNDYYKLLLEAGIRFACCTDFNHIQEGDSFRVEIAIPFLKKPVALRYDIPMSTLQQDRYASDWLLDLLEYFAERFKELKEDENRAQRERREALEALEKEEEQS